jgi:stage IV sporulation protein B
MRKFVKGTASAFLIIAVVLCTVMGFYYTRLPDKYYLADSGFFKIDTFFSIVAATVNRNETRQVYAPAEYNTQLNEDEQIDLCLFGLFPIKRIQAEKIERPLLIPGGIPFGIKILTDGAIVTELGMVDGENGFVSPARNAGIKPGDVITAVNGIQILSNDDVAVAVQTNPDNSVVALRRDERELTIDVKPVRSNRDGLLKIGMWVRDSSAGIGTLTFYNPADSTFGGLGHAVCDVDTGQILPLSSGQAVSVYISGVVKGYPGTPGELCGAFMSQSTVGSITANTEAGIFGVMENIPANFTENLEDSENNGAIEMAYKQEVRVGAATMITTIDGEMPAEYEVMIEKIDFNDRGQVKNMIVRVTDRELLNKSGGIVQGMSGSPLIQNGRLIGAITHVFVSDPTRGYAIFAENMYRESQGAKTEKNQVEWKMTERYTKRPNEAA